ncbi:MAG: SgcJ/EcaC family oxidoreductase [Thiohalomonadales bacterium]
MKNRFKSLIVNTILLFSMLPLAHADNSNTKKIQVVLKSYEQVLNNSDVAGVVKLYTTDGVFMAPHHPSAVGIRAIEGAYKSVFKAIDLDVRFDIVEVETLGDDWAFVRTNSAGSIKFNASGKKNDKSYHQELFLMKKTANGDWKIARYAFSSTNPR